VNTNSAALQLDLTKAAKVLRLQLDKAGVRPDVKAELLIAMDVSSSFEHEHEEGTTSTLVRRLVPLGMELDPDRKIDFLTFSNGSDTVQYLGTVDETESDNYVVNNVVDMVHGWNGGTTYSHALEEALKRFGWLESDHSQASGWSRFWNSLTGATPATQKREQKRSIVLFVTDGENDPDGRYGDKRKTEEVLQASQDRGDKVYFLFIGACEHAEFEYVERIAQKFKNTGIVMATDPDKFVNLPDEELMKTLLVPELIEWLKA
jgi:hypothetical protein